MTRETRIEAYDKMTGPDGRSSSKAALKSWSDRAHRESDGHKHRATDGPMQLPDTNRGGGVLNNPGDHGRKAALADKNNLDSGRFMPGVRRQA